MAEIEAEVKEEVKTEGEVQAMHFVTETMHRRPLIVDHGPEMWPGCTSWSQGANDLRHGTLTRGHVDDSSRRTYVRPSDFKDKCHTMERYLSQ